MHLESNVTEVKGGRARWKDSDRTGDHIPNGRKGTNTGSSGSVHTQPFALGVIRLDTSLKSGSIARPQELNSLATANSHYVVQHCDNPLLLGIRRCGSGEIGRQCNKKTIGIYQYEKQKITREIYIGYSCPIPNLQLWKTSPVKRNLCLTLTRHELTGHHVKVLFASSQCPYKYSKFWSNTQPA